MIRSRNILVFVLAAVSACASRRSEGLLIVGVARETHSGNPWRGGYATLYPDSGRTNPPLADAHIVSCGFFKLRAPGPGRYRVRVAMIGLSAASRIVEVDTGTRDTFEFRASYPRVEMSHGSPYDAVMRPGECPPAAR